MTVDFMEESVQVKKLEHSQVHVYAITTIVAVIVKIYIAQLHTSMY